MDSYESAVGSMWICSDLVVIFLGDHLLVYRCFGLAEVFYEAFWALLAASML